MRRARGRQPKQSTNAGDARHQSARSASLGSTRDARIAGIQLADDGDDEQRDDHTGRAPTDPSASPEEQWRDPSSRANRSERADDNARENNLQTFAHDQLDDVARLRAECDADAHLVRSLRDVVGDHAVEANRRERRARARRRRRTSSRRASTIAFVRRRSSTSASTSRTMRRASLVAARVEFDRPASRRARSFE